MTYSPITSRLEERLKRCLSAALSDENPMSVLPGLVDTLVQAFDELERGGRAPRNIVNTITEVTQPDKDLVLKTSSVPANSAQGAHDGGLQSLVSQWEQAQHIPLVQWRGKRMKIMPFTKDRVLNLSSLRGLEVEWVILRYSHRMDCGIVTLTDGTPIGRTGWDRNPDVLQILTDGGSKTARVHLALTKTAAFIGH